jgi:hypothetical protein
MLYVQVLDLGESISLAESLGGTLLRAAVNGARADEAVLD